MSLFGKIFKGIKKVVKAPIDMVKRAFKGDPLAIIGTLAASYGGYSLLSESGLTGAGLAAAESTKDTATGIVGNIASNVAGQGGMSGAAMGAMNAATQAANAAIGATGATTATGGGLLSNIGKWWGSLDNKEKLMATGLGLKTAGSFMQGIQQDKWQRKNYDLMKRQVYGIGTYKPPKDFKEYLNKAKMWYETDSALQKKVNYMQQRMEDPEYARGFYTMAGLLANPKGQEIIQSDPLSTIY